MGSRFHIKEKIREIEDKLSHNGDYLKIIIN